VLGYARWRRRGHVVLLRELLLRGRAVLAEDDETSGAGETVGRLGAGAAVAGAGVGTGATQEAPAPPPVFACEAAIEPASAGDGARPANTTAEDDGVARTTPSSQAPVGVAAPSRKVGEGGAGGETEGDEEALLAAGRAIARATFLPTELFQRILGYM
jgi:hypothetical protein